MWIEPVLSIGGRLPDRPKDRREREPRRQPEDTFAKALRDAEEREDARRQDTGRA